MYGWLSGENVRDVFKRGPRQAFIGLTRVADDVGRENRSGKLSQWSVRGQWFDCERIESETHLRSFAH